MMKNIDIIKEGIANEMRNTEEHLEHIHKLYWDNHIPEIPDEYAENHLFVQIHEELKTIREILSSYSMGDFTREISFMEDFTNTFNNMVSIFNLNLLKLKKKEKNLTDINNKLRKKVKHMEVLKESEAHFKFLASHDPLTGILNRRAFTEAAEIELSNAAYLCVPCCLAMMDIDHFKKLNDTYGHLAGDEALRHTVRIIESKLRKNDFMGRYGGEEFILFFYDTDKETGFKVLERLRKYLSESPVSLIKGPVEIHASFGFTEIEAEKSAEKGYVQKLIHDADRALYAAKLAGRNKVVLFSPEMESGNSAAFNLNERTENFGEEKAS